MKIIKKIIVLPFVFILSFVFVSCNQTEDISKERILTKNIITSSTLGFGTTTMGSANLLFKQNSTVPYISIKDGVTLLDKIRKEAVGKDRKDKAYYKLDINNDKAIIKNELNASCTLDNNNQQIIYDDFDLFATMAPSLDPLILVSDVSITTSLKTTSSEYKKGSSITVDLKNYSELDIYKQNNEFYLPLTVFNTFMINIHSLSLLAYNFNELYYIPQGELQNRYDANTLSDLGQEFYSATPKGSVSAEYAKYYYQSLLIEFDYLYGLKKQKSYTSFDEFVISNGFKDDMLSGDVKKMDAANAAATTYLNDYHTALIYTSCLYPFKESIVDSKKFYNKFNEFHQGSSNLVNMANEKYTDGYQIIGDTLFLSFARFNSIEEEKLYKEAWDKEDLNSTAILFASTYNDITKTEIKNKIKNIVIDMTYNAGGAADGLLFALSTLIGNVTIDIINPVSGGSNHQTFKADINLDKVVDEKDISLSELGFNIYFLNSEYSFSSANAMPFYAKLNNNKIINLGQKTAGGPCIAKFNTSALGSFYYISGLSCLARNVDGTLVDIDSGIEPDYSISKDKLLDREYIANYIKTLNTKNEK